jgi:hypothetical protein
MNALSLWPANVELLDRTDRYVAAVWRQLLLLIWSGDATVAGIERSQVLFDAWLASQPRDAAFLIVLPAQHLSPPDEATREAIQRVQQSQSGRIRGSGTLFQAEGFIAASVLSVMMRLNVSRGKGGSNLFGTASSAAAWASALLDDPALTTVGLTKAIRTAQGR